MIDDDIVVAMEVRLVVAVMEVGRIVVAVVEVGLIVVAVVEVGLIVVAVIEVMSTSRVCSKIIMSAW